MAKYTAVKENCLRCLFAQWCLNDSWGLRLLYSISLLRCEKCGKVWWKRKSGEPESLHARGSMGATTWNAVRNGDWEESFFGRPWMDGCGVADSVAKAAFAKGITVCLCCTVGLPGDQAIFTEYTGMDMGDLSTGDVKVSLSRQMGKLLWSGKKRKLLLIRAPVRGRSRGKKGGK